MAKKQTAKLATAQRPPQGLKLGLLGGGQLARMIALAAYPLGIEVHVLSEKAEDPAAQVCRHWMKGSPNSLPDLKAFLKDLDVVTFESEFFDMDLVEKARPKKLAVYPETEVMRMIQDRRTQKAFLDKNKLPTAEWVEVEDEYSLSKAAETLGYPFVLKKARGGYDGYGTFFMKKAGDVEKFIEANQFAKGAPYIAEKMIKFKREVAIMLFRSQSGSFAFYPWVETRQTDSRCDLVLGPLQMKDGTAFVSDMKKALAKINYVGAMGVECFETTDGDLVINELAPRVHNTGHYSQDAVSFSQFELHVQAGIPGKFNFPEMWLQGQHFVMANLLGRDDKNFAIPLDLAGGQLNWYGKGESRKGRKLGHINFVGEDLKELETLALKVRKKILGS